MNILGVGGPELAAILIIMLVFAGPKRMVHWSYVLGQHLAKFRRMWSQTVDLVQKEFNEAGVDIQIPKQPPTRQNMNKAITDAMKPVTQPVQESLDEVKKDVESLQEVRDELKNKTQSPPPSSTQAKKAAPKPAPSTEAPAAGSWSGGSLTKPTESSSNGSHGGKVDMGTWSATGADEQGA